MAGAPLAQMSCYNRMAKRNSKFLQIFRVCAVCAATILCFHELQVTARSVQLGSASDSRYKGGACLNGLHGVLKRLHASAGAGEVRQMLPLRSQPRQARGALPGGEVESDAVVELDPHQQPCRAAARGVPLTELYFEKKRRKDHHFSATRKMAAFVFYDVQTNGAVFATTGAAITSHRHIARSTRTAGQQNAGSARSVTLPERCHQCSAQSLWRFVDARRHPL